MTNIQILGIHGSDATGRLRVNVIQALKEMGTKATVENVTDVDKFIQYKINGIPALVLNGTVVLQRQVPEVEDLKILLSIFAESTSKHFDMKKILVPTDFSDAAKDAFHFALELAKIQKSSIKTVHVYHPEFDPQNPYLSESMNLQKETAEERLKIFTEEGIQAQSFLDGSQISSEALIGFPVEEVLKQSEDASLIVMGTTGEKGVLDKLFGSVSINVARRAACPVLLIPGGLEYQNFRHILYASDFESANEGTLEKLVDFANVFKADIHFVHVAEEKSPHNYKEIENKIFKILFKGGEPSFAFTMSKVEGASVVEGINDYALHHQIDMVVMVSPKRSFWDSLFHKSVTKAMAVNTKIPMMVLPA
jgi:nucleotide-binding universal stress UspA family protein